MDKVMGMDVDIFLADPTPERFVCLLKQFNCDGHNCVGLNDFIPIYCPLMFQEMELGQRCVMNITRRSMDIAGQFTPVLASHLTHKVLLDSATSEVVAQFYLNLVDLLSRRT